MADADLRMLLARADAGNDGPLRALVRGYVQQRHALRAVLAFLAAREGGAAIADVPALARARALVEPAGAQAASVGGETPGRETADGVVS
ncbi:hypothetical protein [Roseisolibacter sp. H3M3-2]|uniref:hypothetical protein n=1 Tax=Roseisolibacter sp. H3M3-2 TaxID=3031323 RepID=UPI0023DAF6C7|nr:hypothetical protein [Roseisolibacter sp. H3M3-2]MDF1501368.1 hypothetical protein [Roseisolibacter sp. H3M3-2]